MNPSQTEKDTETKLWEIQSVIGLLHNKGGLKNWTLYCSLDGLVVIPASLTKTLQLGVAAGTRDFAVAQEIIEYSSGHDETFSLSDENEPSWQRFLVDELEEITLTRRYPFGWGCRLDLRMQNGLSGRFKIDFVPATDRARTVLRSLYPSLYKERGFRHPPESTSRPARVRTYLLGLLCLSLLFGIIFLLMANQDANRRALMSEQPAELSLKEFLSSPTKSRRHIALRGFDLGEHSVAAERNGRWTRVWIPIFSTDTDYNKRSLNAVLYSRHISGERELFKIRQTKALNVLAPASRRGLGTLADKLLLNYPSDATEFWIFEEVRDAPTKKVLRGKLGTAILLLVVALLSFVALCRQR